MSFWKWGFVICVFIAVCDADSVSDQEMDLVSNLPGQNFNVDFAQYAGYATQDPASKPLVLWLNGGQGYIWMVHKVPGSEKWDLAMRSRQLWEKFAEDIEHQGVDPQEVLGWKKTGSLLVGKTSQEMETLKGKVDQLSKAGLRAELLSRTDLLEVEPALVIDEEGGVAFCPDDYQMDARRSVAYIEKENTKYATEGRYAEYYNQPVTGLLRSGNGKVEAVQTSKNLLCSKKAIIISS